MTEKDLCEYRSLCAEIKDLSERMRREENESLLRMYEEQMKKCEEKKVEIEKAIEGIEKPDARMIFRYRYLDGMSLESIGQKVGYVKSNVSKILERNMPLEKKRREKS